MGVAWCADTDTDTGAENVMAMVALEGTSAAALAGDVVTTDSAAASRADSVAFPPVPEPVPVCPCLLYTSRCV